MPALVHFRPSEPLSPTIYCPHCTEGDLIVARRRNDAKGPCMDGSGLARTFFTPAALVGAAMCSACLRGLHDRWP